MDIRIEPMANLPNWSPETVDGVKEVHKKQNKAVEKRSAEKKETDKAELKTLKAEDYTDRVISKEDLQNFMLLLVTSKTSPRMYSRLIDDKRKGRINSLLNTRT